MTPIAIKIRLTILVFLLKYTKIFLVMEIISWIILENALEINSPMPNKICPKTCTNKIFFYFEDKLKK